MTFFGYFKGLPYDQSEDSFDEYKSFKNKLPKNEVIRHLETLEKIYTSLPSFELFTGEKLQAGLFIDGDFRFPREFLHYYKNYDIGIPYDYEDYLRGILDED